MQEQKYSIKNWAKDDRPREKLLRKNPKALSDSELLAILINNGTPEKSVIKGSHNIALYLQALLKDYQNEVFAVVFLNQANRIKHFEIISEGGITSTVADPRIILKKAL